MVQWFIRGVLITAKDVIVCYGRRRLLLNADLKPTVNICQREEFKALLGGFSIQNIWDFMRLLYGRNFKFCFVIFKGMLI